MSTTSSMSDLLVALSATLAMAGVLLALVRVSRRADASRLLSKLGTSEGAGTSRRGARSERSLLSGPSERFRATAAGGRLASYTAKVHPTIPFSDVVALLLASVVGGGLAGALLFGGGPLVIVAALGGPVVIDRIMVRLGGRRIHRLEQQLPDALALQSAALKAGHSLVRSLRVVGRDSKSPLAEEVALTVSEIDLGRSVEETIQTMSRRLHSRDVALWVTAMQVHRITGGDLSKILEGLASQIRERTHMRSEVRALTAQARLSGLVVAVAPACFFILLSVTARDQMRVLYTTKLGLLFLTLGLVMQAGGFLWIRWLLRPKT